MGVCRTALESRAFLTCLPNGAGNVEFSDLARIGLHSNRVSATAVRRRPETKAQKWPRPSNVVSPETETNQRAPLIAGISAQGGNSPVARDCVVELVGLEPTTKVLWNMVRVRPTTLVG